MKNLKIDDTICALATGGGKSAIAVIRISGPNSLKITNSIFSKDLSKFNTHSIVYGNILFKNEIIDEVLISKFNNNKSYTGEQTIEISCHGSRKSLQFREITTTVLVTSIKKMKTMNLSQKSQDMKKFATKIFRKLSVGEILFKYQQLFH